MDSVLLSDDWTPEQMNGQCLDAAFGDAAFTDLMLSEIKEKRIGITGFQVFLDFCHTALSPDYSWVSEPSAFDLAKKREDLERYYARVAMNVAAYSTDNKPNPAAVFWPNPERDPGASVFDTFPYVENIGLVTKETPVGSAGSCFAFEIAYDFQRRGFNYVITETETEDAANGVIVEGYEPGVPPARGSAAWGILFNTPSFTQLAEKAFGIRNLPHLLVPWHEFYADPYRENVFFTSPAAYENNYEKHIAAVREALLRSEVFIITLGLNECWEFVPDGSVLSRNNFAHFMSLLMKHRVLTVAENVANIRRFFDIVREHNPTFKLIVSVSPIPFLATARAEQCHVVAANTHSKAVLRVAAEELARSHPDIHYFPSYEMVTVCTRDPWEPDGRHVTKATVARVMQLFDKMFVC